MITMPLIEGTAFERKTYPDLVTEHSALISLGCKRNDLGPSSDPSFRVYGYSLGDSRKPTIMIQAGIHGGETGSHHWPAHFMSFLANPPVDSVWKSAVSRLRSRFHFYLIGCLNPYGYHNNSQGNANAVDINRNYDYNWETSTTPYSGLTKGTSPFSEPESIISRDTAAVYQPVLFIDCHNNGESHPRVWSVSGRQDKRMFNHLFVDFKNTFNQSMLVQGLSDLRVTVGGDLSNTRCYMAGTYNKFGAPTMVSLLEGTTLDDPVLHSKKAINALLMLVLYAESTVYKHKMALDYVPL